MVMMMMMMMTMMMMMMMMPVPLTMMMMMPDSFLCMEGNVSTAPLGRATATECSHGGEKMY
eukprot:2992174-Karenia_brevis.AAC.1